jgi:UDP-N-acetylmuramate dehydrogenase
MNIEQELGRILKSVIKKDELMARHTSWLVGGPADYYLCPADVDELKEIVLFSNRYELPLYILGNGTNLLVLDGGIRGLVVNIGESFCYLDYTNSNLKAGAGTPMTHLARSSVKAGLTGLEFAVGIPGSLGGAVVMNAGAFGHNIGQVVSSIQLLTYEGKFITLGRDELSFAYRSSNLPDKGIVIEVNLALKKGNSEESAAKMEQFLAERQIRHPNLPSAGSVFRNFPDQPAGRIIEEAGLKGARIGGAEVSTQHANFIVNTGGASAADILTLIELIRKQVREKYKLDLQPEVKIVGEES